ncbi:response regulator [Gilvimarinus sp. SDUM040013]|uniref:Response regulator n=1 Tax=Gilvimarinus gilvus TaxID=3058038 RepID=A0ABU4RUP0_9GAMM|nr:response regulator [Gilvimarinus sp. SDUM040013]MDO3388536.1 response regulator [Gilvimarinus sp. SDUM040013]MDX6848592.1 response regulator [Gilvimarinus sp. SDUM040013]
MVVEDSDDDYDIMMEAFSIYNNVKNPVVRFEDGKEALRYLNDLSEAKEQSKDHFPGIILLDLNLPGIDGREVLRQVKSNERLRKIPVVILTTSQDERDIEDCYAIGANTYIQKPVDLDKFFEAIKQLNEYWFEIAILPKE